MDARVGGFAVAGWFNTSSTAGSHPSSAVPSRGRSAPVHPSCTPAGMGAASTVRDSDADLGRVDPVHGDRPARLRPGGARREIGAGSAPGSRRASGTRAIHSGTPIHPGNSENTHFEPSGPWRRATVTLRSYGTLRGGRKLAGPPPGPPPCIARLPPGSSPLPGPRRARPIERCLRASTFGGGSIVHVADSRRARIANVASRRWRRGLPGVFWCAGGWG